MKRPRLFLPALLALSVISFCTIPGIAKDTWLQVRSKNFYLVGNASEKDIRKVGVRLEEFRETFRLLFTGMSLTSPIPTNVIVFKSDSAFKPFKPKRPDGKTETWLAGYFQSGEDANYIVVSTEGDDAEMYRTIFHEYVHYIINTNFRRSSVPQWFNEGLAEYYSTFAIEDDQIAKLGLPQNDHLYLLQQSKLMPLDQLFSVSNRQLHAQGDHSRTIFYAESWALVHYLILSNKTDGLSKFLMAVINGTPQDKAFQDAFRMSYAQMETELRKYVSKNTYQYHNITFKNKLTFDSGMETAPYSEAETNARLGDLLYHTDRADEAETYLLAALKLDPDLSMANTTLGMVKMRQRKYDEAKQYLEKATANDQKNHLAFYDYAYLLSREGQDEFGYGREFSKENADKMRQALKQAIAIAPTFAASYDLLAFVDLVTNEDLDNAAAMLKQALSVQPGNEKFAMRLAEVYVRQDKFDEAATIAAKFTQSDDDEVRTRAERLTSEIAARQRYAQQMADYNKRAAAANSTANETGGPVLRRRENTQPQVDEATLARMNEAATLRFINDNLREPGDGENRAVGYIEKIECKGSAVTYTVRTADGPLVLSGKDFQSLAVNTFTPDADNLSIGCGANLADLFAVLTFKDHPSGASKGDLISLEFVPKSFRLMTKAEIEKAESELLTTAPTPRGSARVVETNAQLPRPSTSGNSQRDFDAERREMMMQHIRSSIRQAAAGEKREMGFLQKIECTNKGVFFNMKTETSVIRLLNPKPESLKITVYTPDLSGVSYGCNTSIMDYPAVFIYTDKPDSKLKTAGEIVSVDFVPKSFTLN